MASSPPNAQLKQPHLVSLVLQSKKALQHGDQLCSKVNTLSNASAQCSIDIMALDAKVKWLSDAVVEQLKLAAGVAKSIEHKRAQLEKQVQEWETERTQHTNALDNILESLGAQLVPPDFHQSSSESSLFGSQHSDPGGINCIDGIFNVGQSPTATLRGDAFDRKGKRANRTKWKTLRDFVDERAIEVVIDYLESQTTRIDDVLASTYDYPENLLNSVSSIQESLHGFSAAPSIEDMITAQENISTQMASHLESLAAHYDQMVGALRESEAGELFNEEDLQAMNRDTDELPAIMAELEEGVKSIEAFHEQFLSAKATGQQQLNTHRTILDDLDELGDIMSEMLQRQQEVEDECQEVLEDLQQQLRVIDDLHHSYVQYQNSFNKLLIEIARRRQYKESAERVVEGMIRQLETMTEEERQIRMDFNVDHGAHIPADICLSIEDVPTRWEVLPYDGDSLETIPEIDSDLLVQARERVTTVEIPIPGSESL